MVDEPEEVPAARESAKLQDALYRIADMASAVSDLPEFYRAMHEIVAELTYGENFYIALYDQARQLMNYAYYSDVVDLDVPDPKVWEPMGTGQARGLTAYVLRTGETQYVPHSRFQRLIAEGEIRLGRRRWRRLGRRAAQGSRQDDRRPRCSSGPIRWSVWSRPPRLWGCPP